MAVLRSILFHLIAYPGSAFLAGMAAIGAPFSDRWVRIGAHVWARWFVGCCRIILGIRLVVRGAVPQTAMIVAAKHQSMFETILTLYLFHHPAVVMKQELRGIPVWGMVAARHGSIFVERGRGSAALRAMLRQGRARAAEDRPIFIFPEGTRVPVGQSPPLKAGLSGLYQGLRLPIVPVALDAGRVWTRGFVKQPGTITLAFQPEVPAGLAREDMEQRVHQAINADPVTAIVRA